MIGTILAYYFVVKQLADDSVLVTTSTMLYQNTTARLSVVELKRM